MTQLYAGDARDVLVARLNAARADLRPDHARTLDQQQLAQSTSSRVTGQSVTSPVSSSASQLVNPGESTTPQGALSLHAWTPIVVDMLFSTFGELRVAKLLRFGRQNMSLIEIVYAAFCSYLPKLKEK